MENKKYAVKMDKYFNSKLLNYMARLFVLKFYNFAKKILKIVLIFAMVMEFVIMDNVNVFQISLAQNAIKRLIE